MKTSLIITTYNSHDFLELSILSAFSQKVLPDEILIADDGSGEPTFNLIERLKNDSPIPLLHVWQPDQGFRLSASRNKAIARASGDYIIQVDGDIIMHPYFIHDHIEYSERGYFLTGSRIWLDRNLTSKLINEKRTKLHTGEKGMKTSVNCLRMPLLSPFFFNYKASDKTYVRGCNMSFWKSDLLRVNGYNEDITGWGREDSEIACRLINSGVKKRFIKFGALQYHLFHKENDKSADERNISLMENTLNSGICRTPNGIVKD